MWNVFNIPPVKPVIYNSILSTRRKFADLVHGYISHDLEHDKIHCCKIVPNLSSFSEEQKIFIIILADLPSKLNLCFWIKVSKRDTLDEINKYLVFMKKIKYEVLYFISGEHFYVTCRHFENWNLFYDLYKLLLSKPITTILGTQFYCSIFCKNLIRNEFMFLNTCSSAMKNSEAFGIPEKATIRNFYGALADDVYSDHLAEFVSSSKEEKGVNELETGTRTFGLKSIASNKITCSNFASSSTKRKSMNFLNDTFQHEPESKRKKTFKNYHTSCHSYQREKMKTSPQMFRETSYAHSSDKILKRKLVDVKSCVNETPLKQQRIKLPGSTCEHSHESLKFHKMCDSPEQSLCKYIKWKIFSDIQHFSSIDYVDLLSSKCDLDECSNILKKSQEQVPNLLPPPQQKNPSFKWSQNNKLKVISTYELNEIKESKDFIIESSVLHKSIKKPEGSSTSSVQIFSKESSNKSNPVYASVNQLKENTQFHPKCSNEHKLELNKNSIKSVSGFKTAGGNAIFCSQTALLRAQNVLQDVLDEKNESFHLKTAKKSYSALAEEGKALNEKGNDFNCNSITDNQNKEVDEAEMDIALSEISFEEECFDEKAADLPLKVNENSIKSFSGFTSAGGNAIKCSQSALLAAKKILQSVSDENNEGKNEPLNSNKSSNSSSHLVQGGNHLNWNSAAFFQTKEVDDTEMDAIFSKNALTEKCFDKNVTNLPSTVNENNIKSLSGFKSAGGSSIKCSQSALLAAQKMLLDIPDENDEDQNECAYLMMPNKGKNAVQSKDNLDRNSYDLYNNKNVDEPQIDFLPEDFFTEKCFDEHDTFLPSEKTVKVSSVLIPSEDVSNTSNSKRRKTLGTRRSLPMLPKKDIIKC